MRHDHRLLECQRLRQQALDYIIEHPGALAPEIIAHYGWLPGSGASRLLDMFKAGELSREQAFCEVKNMYGQPRKQATFAYTAKVKTTKSAAEILAAIKAGKQRGMAKPSTKKRPPWITSNTNPDRPAIKNQGGQGYARPRKSSPIDGLF